MRDRSFIAVCALTLVNQLGFGIVTPVLPAYARSFGLGPADIGLVVAIYGFARFLANVPAGQLADRRGRRLVLIIGTAVNSVASALMVTAGSLPELLIYRLFAGLGAATVITGGQIMVGDLSTSANRGRMMSMYQGVFLIGVGLGPTPGGILADQFGLRAPFIAYATFSILACLVSMFFIRETRPASTAAAPATAGGTPAPAPSSGVLEVLTSRPFLLISFVSFAQFAGRTGAVFTIVPLLGSEMLKLGASQIGLAMTLVSGLNLATVYFSGSFADRFGRKPVIAPGSVVAGVGLVIFAFSGGWWVFMLGAAVWGWGSGISGPAPAAYVADLAPGETRARVFGYFRSMSDIGYIVGPMTLGWIASVYGYRAPLLLTAGTIIVSGVLFWVFAPEYHRRSTPTAARSAS